MKKRFRKLKKNHSVSTVIEKFEEPFYIFVSNKNDTLEAKNVTILDAVNALLSNNWNEENELVVADNVVIYGLYNYKLLLHKIYGFYNDIKIGKTAIQIVKGKNTNQILQKLNVTIEEANGGSHQFYIQPLYSLNQFQSCIVENSRNYIINRSTKIEIPVIEPNTTLLYLLYPLAQ